jgi:hypothetical protein
LVLGSINGFNGATASTNVGIGLTNPSFKLHIVDTSNAGLRVQTNTVGGVVGSFGGNGAFNIDATGIVGGRFAVLENGNVGIGANNPAQKLTVSGTGTIRALVNSDSNAGFGLGLNNQQKWSLATTSGEFQIFNEVLGQHALFIDGASNNVGIGTSPTLARLTLGTSGANGLYVTIGTFGGSVAEFGPRGEFQIDSQAAIGGRFRVMEDSTVIINNPLNGMFPDNSPKLLVNGTIKAHFSGGGAASLCVPVNSNEIAFCGSSIRYKDNVNDFSPGLSLIRRLRPVTFDWKHSQVHDLGLVAEEVATVEPLLVTHNEKGEIEGVKYDRVGVVLINAAKEQQAQIERQEKLIEAQQGQIESLKKLVCAANPTAELCSTNK